MFRIGSDGTALWAWSLGGTANEYLNVLSRSDDSGIIYAGGSVNSASFLVSTADDMFISAHLASDGSLITFKVLGGTGSD